MIIGRDYQTVLKAVLEKIKPTPEEERRDHAFSNEFVARLDAMTPKNVNIELAGSVAKHTNLRGDRDFDVFLLFAPTYSVKELMTLGLRWAKKIARGHKWEIAYAEHPYLIMWMNDVEIDIVPSFKINEASERITSVDRSPLHTRYINSHITGEERDNVRLLKKFLKTAGIYGAEGRIRGFSGYLCELLIIQYGSFMKLLEEAAEWKATPVIDIIWVAPAKELLKKFDGAAMVVMDPVDKERNVAAAVSKTTLSHFIYTAREFLKKPSQEFFFAKSKKVDRKWIQKQIRDRATCMLGIEFRKPKVVEDILWPQLYKFTKKVPTGRGNRISHCSIRMLERQTISASLCSSSRLLSFQRQRSSSVPRYG